MATLLLIDCGSPWPTDFEGPPLAPVVAEAGDGSVEDAGAADAGGVDGGDAGFHYRTCEEVRASTNRGAPCEATLLCSWIEGTQACERTWGRWTCVCRDGGVGCYHVDRIWVLCDGGMYWDSFDAGRFDAGLRDAGRPDAGGGGDGGGGDAGIGDAGRFDAGIGDAGGGDAGSADAGGADAGGADAGGGDAGRGDAG